jgi:hypothetical protein
MLQFTSTFQLLAVLCVVDSIFLVTNALACGSAFGVEKGKTGTLLLLLLLLLMLLLLLLLLLFCCFRDCCCMEFHYVQFFFRIKTEFCGHNDK